MQKIEKYFEKALIWGLVAILVVMPFHAFITILIGTKIDSINLISIWKEVLILALSVFSLFIVLSNRKKMIKFDLINSIALSIIIVSTIVSIIHWDNLTVFLAGIKTDLVGLVLFLIAQVKIKYKISAQKLTKLIIIPAAIVSVLAILQQYFMPVKLLSDLGYGPTTINPVQLVDFTLNLVRVFSTLGGPNQLGAYLIIPTSICLAYLIHDRRFLFALLLPLYLAAIFMTYSRSAWIGLFVSGLVCILISVNNKTRKILAIAFVAIVLAGVAGVYSIITSSKSSSIKNLLLHGHVTEQNKIQSSDEARPKSASIGAEMIKQHPIGYGLGAAGPASYYGSKPVITENWYLQIAVEVGLIGFALWFMFFIFNISELFAKSKSIHGALFIGLGAATVGLMFTNLFLHTYADSTLSLVLMASLGLVRRIK